MPLAEFIFFTSLVSLFSVPSLAWACWVQVQTGIAVKKAEEVLHAFCWFGFLFVFLFLF